MMWGKITKPHCDAAKNLLIITRRYLHAHCLGTISRKICPLIRAVLAFQQSPTLHIIGTV